MSEVIIFPERAISKRRKRITRHKPRYTSLTDIDAARHVRTPHFNDYEVLHQAVSDLLALVESKGRITPEVHDAALVVIRLTSGQH